MKPIASPAAANHALWVPHCGARALLVDSAALAPKGRQLARILVTHR